jgi:hypothetical protein
VRKEGRPIERKGGNSKGKTEEIMEEKEKKMDKQYLLGGEEC